MAQLLCPTDHSKATIVARGIITRPSYLYVLGACFGMEWLEEEHRQTIVDDYHEWIISPEGLYECKLLAKWAPEKVPRLLRDACEEHFWVVDQQFGEWVLQHRNAVEEGQRQYEEQWGQ